MRVCVLSDEEMQDFDVAPYLREYDYEFVTVRRPVMDLLKELKERNEFDVYLNVCEGYEMNDEDADDENAYEGIEVVQCLEELNLPFTGATSKLFDPTREEMQAAADANGVGFAKGYRVHSVEEAKKLVGTLRYPIMVKHPKSYGSTGMMKESRCNSLDEVLSQVGRICKTYGAARMEEFIVGKEYNVLVVDNPDDFSQPFAYPPTELIFPPGEEFWHTVVKWESVSFEFKQVTDLELIPRLQDFAIRMFKAMGIVGYGRCDVRMNQEGELYILEINSNPAIMLRPDEYGPADYMILYDKDGYKGFFDRIFRSALIRHKERVSEG